MHDFYYLCMRYMMEKKEFDAIFRENYSQLLFFARQYVSDEETCRDIVSAAFERLWQHFSSIEPDKAKSFLYVTARNSCIDYARHESRHREYARYVTAMSSYATAPSTLMEREELVARVSRQIDCLKPPTREIFMACYVDRKKYREVADEMGISTSTVKKHIIRALKALRKKSNTP